ncbi:MAG: outer-membrane lipoprotein carrier protein LolA [Bdellovibrionaceae bacterium]|nr:outer-membrane lipoprotein carrier protein LolA [Pseudobdellovibrionaceae bacterium]
MILRLLPLFALLMALVPNLGLAQVKSKTELKSSSAVRVLKEIGKKYRNTNLVKIETNKKVTSELMGKTTEYKGTIYLSKGKFRWENDTPEQSLLMFDGKTIWNVQYPPKDLGGPVQVARAKLDKNTKSQILISTLIGKEPIDKNFEVLSEKTEQAVVVIELKPLSSDLRVKQLTLELEPTSKWILKISYKDDVDNLTVIEMKKTEFIKKENKSLFKYEIPKDAQVTNL